jgi:hypothetical protein
LANAASAFGDDGNPAAEIAPKGHAEAGVQVFPMAEPRARDDKEPCSNRTAFAPVGSPEKVGLASQVLFPLSKWDRLSANLQRREEYQWPLSSC